MEAPIRSQILDSVQGRITPYCQFGIGDFDAKRMTMMQRGVLLAIRNRTIREASVVLVIVGNSRSPTNCDWRPI